MGFPASLKQSLILGQHDKSKNIAHQRARKALISFSLVQVKDDYYSLGDNAT